MQRSWFTQWTSTSPILKRPSTMMALTDTDSVIASARLLIVSASEFVPSEYVEENRCINSVYTNATIVELSIYLLFQMDFYLCTNRDENRDSKIRKSICYQANFFGRLFPGTRYEELIYSRMQLYGTTCKENSMADTRQLLKEVIINTQKKGMHKVALQFPYSDEFHLAARLDYHLKVYFERHRNRLLTIYRSVREVEQGNNRLSRVGSS